jgi:CDP-diacylglycerol--serine O-phosphatidyltransferase
MSVLRFRAPWRWRAAASWPPTGWPVAWIAHVLTLGSLTCGFLSLVASASHDYAAAAALVIAALFFDGMDGAAARALDTESPFGEMMDSLADVAAFGLAPAFLLYQTRLHLFGAAGLVVVLGFVACGTIRLARFPLARRRHHFVGLPIPMAGAFVAVLGACVADLSWTMPFPVLVPLATVGVAILMVSTIEFPKFGTVLGALPAPVRWALCLALVPALYVFARWAILCLLALYLAMGAVGAAGHATCRHRE